MKKVVFVLITAFLILAVSCSEFNGGGESASVRFSRLVAKDTKSQVEGALVNTESLYWMYKATKTDGGIDYGTTDWEAVQSNAGLASVELSGFAPGKWKFQLRGYLDAAHTADKLIYESPETTSSLTKGVTQSVAFSVDIVDGSNGNLVNKISVKTPGTTNVNTDLWTVTCAGVYQSGTADNITPAVDASTTSNIKQGLWKLTYTFKDKNSNELGSCDVDALILNGATTTVTLNYEIETGAWQSSTVTTPTTTSWANNNDGLLPPTVGDIVEMGTYPNDNGNTSLQNNPITWKVLAVDAENKRILVISENILEKRTFGSSNSYATSSIRTYLNGTSDSDFIKKYGLSNVAMCDVNVTGSIETTTVGSGNDKVFLLSKTEVEAYFSEELTCIAKYNGSASSWWLRSPYDYRVYYVYTDGSIYYDSYGSERGVRPAFWYNY